MSFHKNSNVLCVNHVLAGLNHTYPATSDVLNELITKKKQLITGV